MPSGKQSKVVWTLPPETKHPANPSEVWFKSHTHWVFTMGERDALSNYPMLEQLFYQYLKSRELNGTLKDDQIPGAMYVFRKLRDVLEGFDFHVDATIMDIHADAAAGHSVASSEEFKAVMRKAVEYRGRQ